MKLKIKYFRIALVVLIFYSLCFLPISLPTISTTTFDLAKGLVENRIRDFVTLFVLSITISIFTIQAIRNMGLTNDKYFEFYEKSWMIDLLFYFVSSISGMVILSFMSEFLIKNHPDVYFKIYSLIYYLFVIGIIAVSIVFIRIFFLTNLNYQIQKLKAALIKAIRKRHRAKAIHLVSDLRGLLRSIIKLEDTVLMGEIMSLIFEAYSENEEANT